MYFASAMLTLVASAAVALLVHPIAVIVPMVIWLIAMTGLEWYKHNNNGGKDAARRRGPGEEEEETQ